MKIVPPAHTHVLLVDDNRDGLLVRRLLLEELGFEVAIASSGEEGLNVFSKSHFDVVVTDYRMPGMDGVELIASLRKIDASARVILLSGFVDPLGLTEESTGADAVIAKSSNEPAALARWVKRLATRPPVRKPPAAQKNGVARSKVSVVRSR